MKLADLETYSVTQHYYLLEDREVIIDATTCCSCRETCAVSKPKPIATCIVYTSAHNYIYIRTNSDSFSRRQSAESLVPRDTVGML